jgi:phospholipase/carboxylesterase
MRETSFLVLALCASLSLGCEEESNRMSPPATTSAFVERVAAPRQPSAGKPPLLVLLHGIGADENDLLPIAGTLDPRLRVVSLRAPRPYAVGNAWFQIDFRPDGTLVPDLVQAKATLGDLAKWLEDAPARHGTDPDHTYLLGFSQGAMMSLGLLQSVPGRLAGVIALSGRDPTGLFEVTADRIDIAQVPLLVAHGTHDDLLPVANGRAIRDRLQGWSRDFTYREFPVAHGVSDEEIDLVADWLARHLGPARG